MRIIINEEQKNIILSQMKLDEMYGGLGEKVKMIKDYLDKHFAKANATMFGSDGRPQNKEVVAWLDDYKQVVKTITDVQLFYVIQDEFKNILSDKEERDEFIKQVIKDWYKDKITKNYSLSV